MKNFLISSIVVIGLQAFAYDPAVPDRTSKIDLLSQSLTLSEGETKSLALPKEMFVHKLFIQAEATGPQGSYAEVSANGDVKGTLYMPGSDPHYVVTVESNTPSIEVTSIRGRARLIAVKAFVSEEGEPQPLPHECHSKMGKFSLEIIWASEKLESFTTYPEYGKYLLPIKKKAAVAYAIAEAQGDLSGSARPYYEQLLATLDFANPYFHQMLEVENATDLTIRLLAIREKIRALLK